MLNAQSTMLTSVQRTLNEVYPISYPFGNTRSKNVLQDFCCEEGPCTSSLKVLFLGSFDLSNTLQVARNDRFDGMQIHLTNLNPSVVARNITILEIISAPDFNPEDGEDFAFLWDVWYNLEWPKVTRKRFQGVLKDLLNDSFPENVSVPKTKHSEMLKKVWSSWLSVLSQTESEDSFLVKKVGLERKLNVCKHWGHITEGKMENAKNVGFSTIIDVLASSLEKSIGLEGLKDSARQNIREEAKRYFEKGSCRLENDIKLVCLNPTLLDQETLSYNLQSSLCPFDGYLPLLEEELDTSIKSKMMIRSCQKILKKLLSFYRKRLINGKTFELFFYLEDAIEFCYSENVNKFDVIDCSNIADHVGLANLILACSGKLSDNPSAMLFTETFHWFDFGMGSVKLYVENALCCPLSMIPTTYGLRLKSRIELGLPELLRRLMAPINICWQRAPPFRNVVMSPSSALSGFLDQLANVCFDAKFPLQITGIPPGAGCGMLLYTPQTFSYVVNSMIQRLGRDHWLKKDVRSAEMHPHFQLARQTLDSWKDGQKILKISATIPTASSNKLSSLIGIPSIRLILLPKAKKGNCYEFFGPDVHFIDNFQLELEKTSTGFQNVSISFLLIPNHGLEETHRAIIVDITNGSEFLVFESFESVQVEDWSFPYPFIPSRNQREDPSPEEFHMEVDSCVESEDQFHLKINVISSKSVSGLKVETNVRAPCESCHEITLSLNQPDNFKPLVLSLPYPILVDGIRATLNLKSRHVDLVLKKALWEPWPCEYRPADNLHNVLDPDQLKPWKEESLQHSLKNHIRNQFNINVVNNVSLMKQSPLNVVRFVMNVLFSDISRKKPSRCFTIKRTNAPTPDWIFLVHRPVSTTPTGRPFLLLSAFDFQLALKLIAGGKLSEEKNEENFQRIFPGGMKGTSIPIQTAEDSQLLRFVLRLNRTKITPSKWQKKNLMLGEESPWLATFASPLYTDNPHLNVESLNRSTLGRSVNDSNCCAACNKVSPSLKRCSRCRSTVYCSVECQHQHWSQHKIVCKKV
ncbi:uncharacterized protein LOC124203702 [Daphnia pulex]|uniref:uncharacterized protein LOC124203702 n=1 Tax=Daphnia pulex TaxID=6669 RepID=UPI001EDF9EE1|nr:uncharacterized protein LOC124203702 [Daphnia pulex]XP_046456451.1 uncharacterized protein LOC124203702 [Daphnia pulex]XP_046456460.1 uncharacterized protein LOC124203702 [Daphnia pulex]XP_046456465.1 uncharacterized protein LOC124203702 [Daphnia pulex]XP_046456476.1 uncharacterized protein LOC124203702 [Daphnia pulex]XP_046456485.1 uncharacterized protein LOC124203702 [Daphnia pulex]XP_046456493.1 uncharacterized protein LOC124203702 [Daphnia pulex]XP_046456502.1 uncharacterized protein 